MDNEIKEFSDFIAGNAIRESEFHPVDRHFLEPYLPKILSFKRNDFLLCNLESVNNTYTEYLMLCLPELWEDISVDDLIEIISRFTNLFSFYALIGFTYRFVEIDIIELIFSLKSVSEEDKADLKIYLKNQYPNLLKTEADFLFFDEDLIGVKNEDWMYIKQRLLLDDRIKPALTSLEELETYFLKKYLQ